LGSLVRASAHQSRPATGDRPRPARQGGQGPRPDRAPRTGPGAPGRPGSSTGLTPPAWAASARERAEPARPGRFSTAASTNRPTARDLARVNSPQPTAMYFSQIRVDPSDDKYVYVCGIHSTAPATAAKDVPAQRRQRRPPRPARPVDRPARRPHVLVGCDGGFYPPPTTHGPLGRLPHNVAIGQFYHVASTRAALPGLRRPADNAAGAGRHTLDGRGPVNADWVMVGGGDGFVCRVDPQDPTRFYTEGPGTATGPPQPAHRPVRLPAPARPAGKPPYRFKLEHALHPVATNGRTSSTRPATTCSARSPGQRRPVISPRSRAPSPAAARRCRVAAQPQPALRRQRRRLPVGDARRQCHWTNVVDRVGLPGPRWVASIEPSRHVEGGSTWLRRPRSDDDEPYLYVSEDYGQSWKSIRSNLPAGSTRVLRRGPGQPGRALLRHRVPPCGCRSTAARRGPAEQQPATVAVPSWPSTRRRASMVAATHGRSLWVLDVCPCGR